MLTNVFINIPHSFIVNILIITLDIITLSVSFQYFIFSFVISFMQCYRYIFSFAIGAGPVTGIIIPELSSTRTRGKIMGFSFSTHWVGIKASSVNFPL